MPLLWVCRIFRTVVLSRFFTRYGLCFDKDTIFECTIPCTRCQKRLNGPFRLMTKEITMSVDPWKVYSGNALAALSQISYNNCSFPLARTLKVTFVSTRDNEENVTASQDIEANISAFVRRIRQLAPRLNMVKMSGGPDPMERVDVTYHYFGSLTTQLVQITSRIDISYGFGRAFHFLNADAIRNLTYLASTFELGGEQTVQLIRQNAPTLQYLHVAYRCVNISGIIQDADGSYVEYPRLETLEVYRGYDTRTPQRYIFDGAVPFPSLRRLVCVNEYPFGDDLVLFRGNAATLEFLQLTMTRELAITLPHSNTFTATSHPKLQCVILKLHPSMMPVNYADDPEIIRFMMDIAPDAAVRKISEWCVNQLPPPLLSLFSKHTSLQVLDLPGMSLSIWDAMTLIQSLPLLSDIHAAVPTLDPMPDGVTARNVVTYVTSNYSPMGTRFRCWHFRGDISVRMKDKVKPFLLLALACPNFDYAAALDYEREKFAKLLEKTIDTAAYKKHAPRLRRLLFGGWRNNLPVSK
ncbi:hypothetical protein GGI08_005832 [Coemansia sp. S2]|nr:hypothetical protein GGI08_005832 [Coemansia sp. S2]